MTTRTRGTAAAASEPPAKKQRILSKACELCKAKKSRCDSARPCSACRHKGVECVYREKGQPGLRPGYGKAMETRMSILEANVQKIGLSVQEVLQHLQMQSESQQNQNQNQSNNQQHMMAGGGIITSPPTPPTTRSTTDSLQTTMWPSNAAISAFPSTPGMAEWLSSSLSGTGATPTPAAPLTFSPQPTSDLTPGPQHSLDNGGLGTGLPPREILQELVELYFSMVSPWAPLFYKPTLQQFLFESSPSSSRRNRDRTILLHAMVVIGFRFWTKPLPSPETRAAYVRVSREHVMLAAIDSCSVRITQALTLLALDGLGQGPGPRTWNIMAMLVAATRQLGLATRPRSPRAAAVEANTPLVNDDDDHENEGEGQGGADGRGDEREESTHDEQSLSQHGGNHLSNIETEEKRRLFWVIYSLDRFTSICHGHPGAIDTNSIRLLYPASDADWGCPQGSTAAEWFQFPTATMIPQAGGAGAGGGHLAHQKNSSLCGSGTGGGMISPPPPPSTASSQSKQGMLSMVPPVVPMHTLCADAALWHHYIDILTLVDRSHRLLIQPVNVSLPAHCLEWQSNFRRLDMTLSSWFENLPRAVRQQPAVFNPHWTMVHATFLLISIRMYLIAAFPATTSPYLRPSTAARSRLRQAGREMATLVASHQPHELGYLGPMFAFIVWVAARGLTILWTRQEEEGMDNSKSGGSSSASLSSDIETLLASLRYMGRHWPCAQRYADIVQVIIDNKDTPGGAPGLDIFADPRRTTFVIQSRFRSLIKHEDNSSTSINCCSSSSAVNLESSSSSSSTNRQPSETPSKPLDFFDMPVLDANDLNTPLMCTGPYGDIDEEWL